MPLQEQDPERVSVVFLFGESLAHRFPTSFDLISVALLKSLIPKSTKHSIFNLEREWVYKCIYQNGFGVTRARWRK